MQNEYTYPIIATLSGLGLGWVLEYFGLTSELFWALPLALVIDFILGVAAAYKMGKCKVSSKKARDGLFRKMSRWLLPFIVIWALRLWGVEDVSAFSRVIMTLLIFIEIYSSIGHIYNINTGKCLPEIDAFEILIGKITGLTGKLIKGLLDAFPGTTPNDKKGE